jgi:hypothetical protein
MAEDIAPSLTIISTGIPALVRAVLRRPAALVENFVRVLSELPKASGGNLRVFWLWE